MHRLDFNNLTLIVKAVGRRRAMKMNHTGKWLLATIVLVTVSQLKVTAFSHLIKQENTTNVVDDMYNGCRSEAMKEFISLGLLQKELGEDKEFQKAWEANANCSKQISGGKREHNVAISAYTDESQSDFQKSFDKAVETNGKNIKTYTDSFHFKSLHFLLMDSMTLLKPNECKTTFAFLDESKTPNKGATVRIGSFSTGYSTLRDLDKVEDVNDRIVLNITTCFYVDLETHSCSQHKNRVLLSPAELYNVSAVEDITSEDADYTMVVLKHFKLHSEHNCYIFSGAPAVGSSHWLLSVFVALTFYIKC